MLDTTQTVAQIVLDHSECAPVFQRNRIDYCCRGKMPLAEACAERRLEVARVVAELEQAIATRSEKPSGHAKLTTSELIDHIVATHHGYLREAVPFVQALAAKVARVHGDRNERLEEVAALVEQLAAALMPHLEQEERVLFPALCSPSGDRAAINRELAQMHEDHLAVGQLLERLRDAAEDFRAPEWACTSYRTLFAELEALEGDVLRHVHLENHVLMPRFASA